MSLDNPRNDLHSSLSLFAKQAKHSDPFIHFTHDKIDQPRSLNYDELLQNRTRGSWENEPDKARAYVTDRRATEDAYRKKLKGIGVEHGPDQSFLYATMKDRQRFGDVADGLYKHDVNLSPEDVEQTLFDLVGLPEDQLNPDGPQLGQAGLDAVTKLWDENQENLRDEEYMGMSIRPRIEVITPGIQRKDSAIHGKGLSALLAGLREKSQLAGSRGRAHKYGRPEPEGRDYDRLLLTDDPKEQEQYKRQLEQLIAGGGYTRRDRPDGFLTATSPDEDISVYPTSKLDDIHKAWELIEGGMSKDEAWAALNSEAKTASINFKEDHVMNHIEQLAKLAAAMNKQAGSYKSNLGPELAKEIANSRPQNKPGFIPPLPANPPPGAAQVIRNLPAFENAMKAFRGIGILPPEVPAKVPAKKPAKGAPAVPAPMPEKGGWDLFVK